jgi:2-(1,2-epoxy-1,2-dihydrophenyl)acetyl-CoA isomerase
MFQLMKNLKRTWKILLNYTPHKLKDLSMSKTVLLSKENHIATITLNRPQNMNSYNDEMSADLYRVTQQLMLDEDVRAVLLCGAGELFMAGGDLKYFHDNLSTLSKAVHPILQQLSYSINALQNMQKPVLASVHGSVAGVGLSLMLAADLVIAAEGTRFTTAYSKIGLSPDGGASYFLPRIVGTKKSMQLFMMSEQFDAKSAQELGLINWVVPKDELQKETQRIIDQLAKGPTQALAGIKSLVNQASTNNLTQQLTSEAASFVKCTTTNDFQSGVTAFVNKKPIVFEGK